MNEAIEKLSEGELYERVRDALICEGAEAGRVTVELPGRPMLVVHLEEPYERRHMQMVQRMLVACKVALPCIVEGNGGRRLEVRADGVRWL